MSQRLENRRAVVVGVGSPMGKAIALRFADEGAAVMAVDPTKDVADEVAGAISAGGGAALAQQAAYGSETDIARVAARCAELWQRVDILMVTAGAFDWWPQSEDSMEKWEAVIRVNLLTPAFYTHALRPLLAKSGSGSVIYYGSIDGIRGNPRIPVYSASRGALVPYTHVMAHTLGPEGVRVNYIAGGAITPLGPEAQRPSWPAANANESLRATPLGRRAEPEDVAGIAAFLASSDSAYVSGSVITMDGGRLAITPGTDLRLENPAEFAK